jgi:hypothetical protein
LLEVRGRKKRVQKNHQIHICGFHCVVKHIEGLLKIFVFFLIFYSQIWLNLLKDDCHFSYQTYNSLTKRAMVPSCRVMPEEWGCSRSKHLPEVEPNWHFVRELPASSKGVTWHKKLTKIINLSKNPKTKL